MRAGLKASTWVLYTMRATCTHKNFLVYQEKKNGSSFYVRCSMTSQVTIIIKLGQEKQMVLLLDRTHKAL
jgi:hypothetical protein